MDLQAEVVRLTDAAAAANAALTALKAEHAAENEVCVGVGVGVSRINVW